MPELKAWEKRVGGLDTIDDPEDAELVQQFNSAVHQILKNSAKPEKQALVKMIDAMGNLYNNEQRRSFRDGYEYCSNRIRGAILRTATGTLNHAADLMKKCVENF
ncbi:MAG: hypothetical protein ACYC0Q_06030 [Eubacteriales bacterium]